MYFVLLAFNDNLFAQNQLYSLFICKLASENKDSMSGLETNNVVSSANGMMAFSHEYGISFTYNRFKRGPRIDPWGTPHLMSNSVDL